MKKYFFIAVAAVVALAACTKNEADTTAYEQAKVINFNTVANKATKATDPYTGGAITGSTYHFNNLPFGVFAWYLKTGDWSTSSANTTAVNYMDNVTVSFDDDLDIWTPSSTYYWPLEGKLTFIGYSPAVGQTGAPTGASFSNAGLLTLTGFSVNTTVANQVDLLYSAVNANKNANESAYTDSDNTKNSGSTKGVNIQFKHALAQVVFQAKTADAVYARNMSFKINSITVNAGSTATMTVQNPATGDLAAVVTNWTAPTSPQDFLVNTSAFPNTTLTNATENFLTDQYSAEIGDELLMIPLKDPDTADNTVNGFDGTHPTVTIDYQLYRLEAGDANGVDLGHRTVTVKFEDIDGTVKEWLAGKKYIYQFTIDLDKIYFNPTVTDWAAGGTQTFDVPKDGTTI